MNNHPYLEIVEKTLREIVKNEGPFIYWSPLKKGSIPNSIELADRLFTIASELLGILQIFYVKVESRDNNEEPKTLAYYELESAIKTMLGEYEGAADEV